MGQQAGNLPVSHRKGCQYCRAPHQLVVNAVRYRARCNAGAQQSISGSQHSHVQAALYDFDSLQRQHTTVKACRRESSTLEGRVDRCTCLRKLVRRTPIVSEWALQMLHGCSEPPGGRAAPTSCRRCPRLPRFLFSRCVHQCFKMPGSVCCVTPTCCAGVTEPSSNSARSGVNGP